MKSIAVLLLALSVNASAYTGLDILKASLLLPLVPLVVAAHVPVVVQAPSRFVYEPVQARVTAYPAYRTVAYHPVVYERPYYHSYSRREWRRDERSNQYCRR